jgi:protein gp37
MGDKTKISWTDKTFNPVIGCQKVGPGCDHCYAEAWDKRIGNARANIDSDKTKEIAR